MRIEIQGDYGHAAGPFDMDQRDALVGLPDGQWPTSDGIRFRVSAANVDRLRQLAGVAWHDPAARLAELDAIAELQRTGFHRQPTELDRGYGFRTEPFRHQLRAFAFARLHTQFALFCDPGTGKSKMLLDIAAAKFEADEIDCVLIVAPNGVHRQWLRSQLPRHMPDVEHVATIYSRSARKMAEVMDGNDRQRLRILSVNVEALSTNGQTLRDVASFVTSGRCLLAVDESTRIKNMRAKRTQNILSLGEHAAQRAILTGTPITRNILDLYAQFAFLNRDILGFRSFVKFRERYCVTAPAYRGAAMGVVKVIGTKNLPELMAKFAPYTFKALKSECLDLPAKVYEQREIELTPEQRRHYNELVRDFHTSLTNGSLTALNAVARITRLQQVLSGYLPRNDGDDGGNGEVETFPENRTGALVDFIEDIGDRQLVVWCRFQRDADAIGAALQAADISHVVCDGRVPPALREVRKEQFMSGAVQVYVGNPAAVGTGTDGLQVAGLAVFYSHTFDAERRWQAEDRTHRQGLEHDSMTYVEFVAPETVDELFLSNNADKRQLVDRIMAQPNLLREV